MLVREDRAADEQAPAELAVERELPGERADGRQSRGPDLLLCFGVAVLGFVLASGPAILSLPLGLAAVLLAPGYALIAAALPSDEHIDMIERLALSLAASIGIVALVAFALDKLPGGLAATSIRAAVALVTIVCLGLAAVQRRRHAVATAADVNTTAGARSSSRAVRFTRAIVAVNVVVAAFAYVISVTDASPRPTAFYVLGPDGKMAGYPRQVRLGETVEIRVGIEQANNEGGSYTIEVQRDGQLLTTVGPAQVGPGERWESEVRLVADKAGPDQELVLLAYRGGDAPFRTLRLWLDVLPGEAR